MSPKSYESVSPTEPLWLHENMTKYGVIIACKRDTDTYIHIHTYIYTYIHTYTIYKIQANTYTYIHICIGAWWGCRYRHSLLYRQYTCKYIYIQSYTYIIHAHTNYPSNIHMHTRNIAMIQVYITAVFTYKILCIEKCACILLVFCLYNACMCLYGLSYEVICLYFACILRL